MSVSYLVGCNIIKLSVKVLGLFFNISKLLEIPQLQIFLKILDV